MRAAAARHGHRTCSHGAAQRFHPKDRGSSQDDAGRFARSGAHNRADVAGSLTPLQDPYQLRCDRRISSSDAGSRAAMATQPWVLHGLMTERIEPGTGGYGSARRSPPRGRECASTARSEKRGDFDWSAQAWLTSGALVEQKVASDPRASSRKSFPTGSADWRSAPRANCTVNHSGMRLVSQEVRGRNRAARQGAQDRASKRFNAARELGDLRENAGTKPRRSASAWSRRGSAAATRSSDISLMTFDRTPHDRVGFGSASI